MIPAALMRHYRACKHPLEKRACNLSAVVIPGAQSVLLGALPLEDMDLIVNPVKQQLEGAHGDEVEALALSIAIL